MEPTNIKDTAAKKNVFISAMNNNLTHEVQLFLNSGEFHRPHLTHQLA